jgi:hypothetical protein
MNARATLSNDKTVKENGGETVVIQTTQMRIYLFWAPLYLRSQVKSRHTYSIGSVRNSKFKSF